MKFENKELILFENLEFPYSKEFKDLRNQIKPNLKIDNQSQSLFLIIKYIRNEIIFKKLKNQKTLVFDKYINDILNIDINIDSFYPPENLNKLDKFITELKLKNIFETQLNLIIYYILKDFSFTRADEFIEGLVNPNEYNFINSIYFLDRFDLLKSLHYLNSLDQFNINNKKFINHIVRLANVIPFQPEVSLSSIIDISSIQSYLDIKSTDETSLSVISIFNSLNINPILQDLDIFLIYLDSITDISVNDSLIFFKSIINNYSEDLLIPLDLIFKIILIKILIKTVKQRKQISILKTKILDNYKFNQIYESLPIFQLFNFENNEVIESKLLKNLYDLISNNRSKEEDIVRLSFPNFWKKLDEFNKEIKQISKDFLILKEILSIDTDKQEVLNLSVDSTSFN